MKIKKGSLLTILLAALCAVAVALGVSLMLPKAEKINANAAANTPQFVADTPIMNSGSFATTNWPAGGGFCESGTNTTPSSGVYQFYIKITVPAYTEYIVSYLIDVAIQINEVNGGSVSGSSIVQRYEDSTYSNPKGAPVSANVSSNVVGTKDNQALTVNNLIFPNDTGVPKDYYTYFGMQFLTNKMGSTGRLQGFVYFTNNTVTVSKLAAPSTNDTLEFEYDGEEHTVNFEYAKVQPAKTDVDGNSVSYNNGYKNVEVTVDAVDGKGNKTSSYTFTTDTSKGSGNIKATNAGTYTITFKISDSATSNGIAWDGGTTTIVLKIKKKDPTVNPKVGEGPWYTTNDLVKDIKIETSDGDTPGKISWDSGQTLAAGTNNYAWTFKPTDDNNYNDKQDTEAITVEGLEITSIKAKFTQGTTRFYTSSDLDDLKVKLAVSKVYNDKSEEPAADYELDGDISTAGTVTITVTYTSAATEKPAMEEFTDTFEVEITEVILKSIEADFSPTKDIYLSNSLDDLKEYLTVTGTYNDKSTNTLKDDEYTLETESGALSLGTVKVTVVSVEDGTIKDTFTVNVLPDLVPIELPIPEADDLTYSGEEFDIINELKKLTSEQVIKYLDVSGTTSGRNAGEYVVKFTIRSEFIGNVNWEGHTATLTKYALSSKGVTAAEISEDGRTATLTWKILKAKVAATWDSEECVWIPVISGTLAETTEPDFLTQTYTNSDGKSFTNRSKLAGGRTYQVTAAISPKYANNFELDDSTQTLINSGSETYTYTPEYVPSLWEKIVAFLKANWLWLVIAIAALILLIVIIVVAVKRHKTKEERAEKKAAEKERKEEEKRRREEERRRQEEERRRKEEELAEEKRRREEERKLQQERLEEERRLQKEKLEHERELERIKAQAAAGAGMAGMASMAMAQQPAQQAMPTPQPVQQVVDNSSNELLREMTRQMAELRADNKATQAQLQAMQNSQQNQPQPMQMPMYQQQPMYPQYPMYQQMPMQMPYGGGNDLALARMEAQLNAMQAEQRARYDAEQRIELAAMRAESHVDRDSRHSVDLAAMREHINGYNYNRLPDYSAAQLPYNNQPNNMDMMGALVAATLKNMANGEVAATQVPELPQNSGQSTPTAKYPSDAVITTTTTVDTTKNGAIRRDENFDIDGFYDPLD